MQIKHFAQLQFSINRGTVYDLPFSTEPNYKSVTLALLNLARNCQVQSYSHLSILQQITSIISTLVKFNPPVNYLAAFDRQKFIQAIKNQRRQNQSESENDIFLIGMVQGIYPHKKVTKQISSSLNFKIDINSVGEEEIGNKNWKLTRRVIQHYYNIAAQRHKECLQVLLGMPELRDTKYAKFQWRSLWTQLYLTTYSILINQDQKVQVTQGRQFFQEKISQVIDFTIKSNYQLSGDLAFKKCILKLVGYIVKKFIFEKQGEDLKEFSQIFIRVEQGEFPALNKYLISLILTINILQKNNLREECNRFKAKLDNFINEPSMLSNFDDTKSQKNQIEAIKLRSFLISNDKLPNFLLENGLKFQEYDLGKEVKEYLAERCLLQYQKLPGNIDWSEVFKNLSQSAFEKYILKAGKKWLNHSWAKYLFYSALQNQSNIIQKKFSSRKQKQMKPLTRPFFEQWQHFQNIQIYSFRRCLNQVEKILTFNLDLSEQTKKMILFPGNDQKYYVKLLIDYMKYVIQEGLINDKYHIFFSSQLATNLLRVENYLLDDFWSLWADLLIYRDFTLHALLKIEVDTENILLQNSLIPNENSTANESLFLRQV